MADLSYVSFPSICLRVRAALTLLILDRLSTNGWEGQSLVVTLSRTCAPTRPIAGPTKGPACVFPGYPMPGYSTPPRVSHNLAGPASPE